MRTIIVWLGILLVMAGCGPAVQTEKTADAITEGWYHPKKTVAEHSQDYDYCNILCLAS